ncbi:MAG: K+-dependent Na+/Ca+ exchanger [Chitinophagales bacterium]|nr:MAG: K+-dependent Na+/Ca+ exchanger [Chitinophagales bacterium]
MFNVLLLIGGLIILLYGGNILVDSASALAKRLNIPNMVIALTIVAFGTSAPELAANLVASLDNNSGIVLGNVIGSNLFNILCTLGIASMLLPLTVKSNTTWIEIPLCVLSSLAVWVVASDTLFDHVSHSVVSRADGLILILFFLVFLGYNVQLIKQSNYEEEFETKDYSLGKALLLIVIGLGMLTGGAKSFVYGASQIAEMLGVSQRIIGLTIVSIGTSLPELITSVISVRKRNVDMAIGNIVGSNIFNVFFILGSSAVVSPVMVEAGSALDLIINLVASFLLFIFIFSGKGRQLDRWNGAMLFSLYLAYMGYLLSP